MTREELKFTRRHITDFNGASVALGLVLCDAIKVAWDERDDALIEIERLKVKITAKDKEIASLEKVRELEETIARLNGILSHIRDADVMQAEDDYRRTITHILS